MGVAHETWGLHPTMPSPPPTPAAHSARPAAPPFTPPPFKPFPTETRESGAEEKEEEEGVDCEGEAGGTGVVEATSTRPHLPAALPPRPAPPSRSMTWCSSFTRRARSTGSGT